MKIGYARVSTAPQDSSIQVGLRQCRGFHGSRDYRRVGRGVVSIEIDCLAPLLDGIRAFLHYVDSCLTREGLNRMFLGRLSSTHPLELPMSPWQLDHLTDVASPL